MKIKKILVSQPKPADIKKTPYENMIKKYGVHVDFEKFITFEGVVRLQSLLLNNCPLLL